MLQRCKYYHIFFLRGQNSRRNIKTATNQQFAARPRDFAVFLHSQSLSLLLPPPQPPRKPLRLSSRPVASPAKASRKKAECGDKKFHRVTFFTKS